MTVAELLARLEQVNDGAIPFEKLSLISLTNIYLFASFAYYVRDFSLMADQTFDRLCKYLYDSYEFMEASGVRYLGEYIIEGNLQAGTCLGVDFRPALVAIVDEMIALKEAQDL